MSDGTAYGQQPDQQPPRADGPPPAPQYGVVPPSGPTRPVIHPYQGVHPGYGPPAATYPALPHHEAYGPGRTMFPEQYKDATAAWLLWVFLAGFGAHDFYLRRTGAGVAKLVLTIVALLTAWIFIGLVPALVVFVWWIIDATTMSDRLQQVNAEIYAHNRALGAA